MIAAIPRATGADAATHPVLGAASAAPGSPDADPSWMALRGAALFAAAGDDALRPLHAAGHIQRLEVPRDTMLEPPAGRRDPLCLVRSGQISIGVFDPAALAERGRQQRDAALGEKDGTLLPPGPLARTARQNLALLGEGELFNLAAFARVGDDAH